MAPHRWEPPRSRRTAASRYIHSTHPGTLDEFGRGLLIVGRLVMAWGTRRTPDGKTVWAEVALPPHP